MQNHKLLRYTTIIAAGVFSLAACSKKNDDDSSALKEPSKKEVALPSATPAGNTSSTSQATPSPVPRKIASENMREIIEMISSQRDTISALKDGLQKFDHPAFEQPAKATALVEIMDGKQPSLLAELRNPTSRWNADPRLKESVVGKLSLITALFGASTSNVALFPDLISANSDSSTTTEGDVVMLQIVQQAVKSVQKRMPLDDSEVPRWENLATSPKAVDRATAIIAFSALQPTPEQATRFYSAFLHESDPQVAKILVEQIGNAGTPDTAKLLEQFKRVSKP